MNELEKTSLKIKLSKQYTFEDATYEEINLEGMEDITSTEMIKAENAVKRNKATEVLPEMSMEYACYLAHYATKIPVEFFLELKAKDAVKLKTAIQSFLY